MNCKHDANYISAMKHFTSLSYNVRFIIQNRSISPVYITKTDASKKGWKSNKGNLCQVLPNRAIGGDKYYNNKLYKDTQFTNITTMILPTEFNYIDILELPKWYEYIEMDLNYVCGYRNGDRLFITTECISANGDDCRMFVCINKNIYKEIIY